MTVYKATRSRSVILDSVKVRNLAKQRGFNNWLLFEGAIAKIFGENNTTAKNIWHGKKVDKSRATEVALFLGLPTYAKLLPESCPDIIFPEKQSWDARYAPAGSLLKPRYRTVPFHNRQEELDILDAWCESADDLAVRLCTGTWGIGKTRLAIKQCERLAQHNKWITGFLAKDESREMPPSRFEGLESSETPMFIVIDSCETRREEIVELLKFALRANNKLRILLLARTTGDWWDTLRTEAGRVGELLSSRATSRLQLGPVCQNHKQKAESFLLATDSFASALNCEPPLLIPEEVDQTPFDRILMLHMKALIHIEKQQSAGDELNTPQFILNRERHKWEQRANDLMLPKGLHPAIGEVMLKITGHGGVTTKQQVAKLLDNIKILSDCKVYEKEQVMKLLHSLYPSQHQSHETVGNAAVCHYIEPFQKELVEELSGIL